MLLHLIVVRILLLTKVYIFINHNQYFNVYTLFINQRGTQIFLVDKAIYNSIYLYSIYPPKYMIEKNWNVGIKNLFFLLVASLNLILLYMKIV